MEEGSHRIVIVQRNGRWIARAEREGKPFGIECTGSAEDEVIERLTNWLEWQREHAAALEALRVAERAFHRTIAGSAFASPTEGPSPLEMQKESLRVVESARVRLDEVRARQPESGNRIIE
jgi:hypothetical protein